MRIIITGGTGLIGRALGADLAARGYEVVALSRQPGRSTGLPAGIRVVRWDGRTAEGWGSLAEGSLAIVNLAGENLESGRWTAERKQGIRQSRLDAGRAVVEAVAASATKPKVVIQSSGVGYYGTHETEEFAEAAPPGSDFLARVAVDWEAATASVEAMGVRRAVIRSAVVLSATGGALPKVLLPFRFLVGGPIGSGQQPLSWVHIADEVAAIRFLIENEQAQGPFNLSAPNTPTNAAFARAIGRAMGRPAWMPVPAFAMRLVFGEMASLLLQGQRTAPRRLLDLGFAFQFTDAEAAVRDLLRRHA